MTNGKGWRMAGTGSLTHSHRQSVSLSSMPACRAGVLIRDH